ncbi:MAG: lantibiotic dehydratase [Ignavibacteria bacterium]|nr:lantibiotic dehydratase [Ignavibacteria bacterium]
MEIFPLTLIRIGGGSFDCMSSLKFQQDDYLEITYEKVKVIKNEISELIYQIIPELKSSKEQNILLNLRRDIFNDKKLQRSGIDKIDKIVDKAAAEKIGEYFSTIENIDNYLNSVKDNYDNALIELCKNLRDLTVTECIRNGFVFSSHSLLKNFESYLKHEGEYTKDIKKTEVSLIKYLSRTYTKTSPFSSFNSLAIGKLSQNRRESFLYYPENEEIKASSIIRVNNNLFFYLRNCILNIRELFTHLYLIANPTITKQGSQYRYLINYTNLESFQKIELNPILDYIYEHLKEKRKLKFCDLISLIFDEEVIDADEDELENYVYKLIEVGFFEFDIGISGLNVDWITELVNLLKIIPVNSESKNIIVRTLEYLNSKAREMVHSGSQERYESSIEAFGRVTEMKACLDLLVKPKEAVPETVNNVESPEAGKEAAGSNDKDQNEEQNKQVIKNVQYYNLDIKPESLFYEDTILNDQLLINSDESIEIINNANKLMSYFKLFEGHKDEMEKVTHYFKKKYNINEFINLLTFYEEYIGYKKEERKRKDSGRNDENNNEEKGHENKENVIREEIIVKTKDRKELQNKWLNNIFQIIKKENYTINDEIKLNEKMFMDCNKQSEIQEDFELNSSLGFFLQFYEDKTEEGKKCIKSVINSSFSGYGKMVSRFLNLFPDEFTKEIRKWNEKYSGDYILAENIDSSIMNYNLHPALMPYEISIPGGNYVLEPERRISVSQLVISYNKKEDNLQLTDTLSNKRVFTFDLGFQGYGGRSELFKFLETFTLSKTLFLHPLLRKIFGLFNSVEMTYNHISDKVSIRPRISYNDKLIISRREWIIPTKLLPFKHYNEKESDYFTRIQKWRVEFGLPEEMFFFIKPMFFENKKEIKAKKNFTRDDYKPQYICFGNPFLIRLFEKQLGKVIESMKFVEMLPASNNLLKINNKRYVTEFVNQTYNF